MRRIQAAPVNLNLPPGWVLPQGWQAYAMFALLPLFWLIGLSAIVWVLVAIPLAGSLALRRGDWFMPPLCHVTQGCAAPVRPREPRDP